MALPQPGRMYGVAPAHVRHKPEQIMVLNYAIQFFTERFDEQTFSSWCEGYCDYDSDAKVIIFAALIALVTAYSLFPREHDDATIDFLDRYRRSYRAFIVEADCFGSEISLENHS